MFMLLRCNSMKRLGYKAESSILAYEVAPLQEVYIKPPQRLIVYGGRAMLFDEAIESVDETIRIPIPGECIEDSNLRLSFEFPNAVSPKSLGEGDDSRELAFALTRFSLEKQ